MKSIVSALMLLMSMSVFSQEVAFERGNTMYTDEISGYVHVQCRDEKKQKEFGYRCYDVALKGGSYGKIAVTNGTVDADWVKLQREGTRHIKGASFDVNTQMTGKKFNLWIRTLLQRALLKKGQNTINYTFTKDQNEVLKGVMNVEVKDGESRVCSTGTLWYSSRCPSAYQACQDYFARHNYCR